MQAEISDFASSLNNVCAFPVRANNPAAVYLNLSILANQSKFNRVPKQPAQALQNVRILYFCAHASIVLKEIRKYRVRVHRNVAENVMENVRLRNVFQRIAATQPRGCRKHARGEHFKKSLGRQKTTDWRCAPSGSGF